MIKKHLPALIVASIAMLPLALWFHLQRMTPSFDAADYLEPALRAHLIAKTDGYWDGLRALFWKRTWKPIAFPLLAVPGILLTGANLRAVVAGTMLLVQFALGFYTYKLLHLRLRRRTAGYFTFLLLTLPFILATGNKFFTENVIALAVVAFLYHLHFALQTWHRRDVLAVIGWLAFALLIRPIEGLVMLGPIFGWVCWRAYQAQQVERRIFYWTTALVVPSVILLVLDALSLRATADGLRQVLFFCPLIVFAGAVWEYRRSKQVFGPALMVAVAGVTLWYVPFTYELVLWVYQCTFGELAVRSGEREPGDWFTYFRRLYRELNGPVFVLLTYCALLTGARKRWKEVPWIWMAVILPICLFGFNSNNGLSRYYTTSALLMFIIVAWLIRPYSRKHKAIVGCVLLLCSWISFYSYERGLSGRPMKKWYWHMFFPASVEHPWPTNDFASFYTTLSPKLGPSTREGRNIVFINLVPPEEKRGVPQVNDPWAINILALSHGSFDNFDFGATIPDVDDEQQLKVLHCLKDFIVIGPVDGSINSVWDGGSKMGIKVLAKWREKKLAELNLSQHWMVEPHLASGASFLLLKTEPAKYDCRAIQQRPRRELF